MELFINTSHSLGRIVHKGILLCIVSTNATLAMSACGDGKATTGNGESPQQNRAPVADASAEVTDEDTALAITLTGTDPDGDSLTFAIATDPEHGTLSGTAPDLTYTPVTDFHGADSFTFTVSDSELTGAAATVSIAITPVNDPPILGGTPTTSIATGDSYSFTPTAADVEGDTLTFSVTGAPEWTDFDTSTGALTGTPSESDIPTFGSQTHDITITGSDGAATDELAFTLTVEDGHRPVLTGELVILSYAEELEISWTNPSASDLSALLLLRRNDGFFPTGPTDATAEEVDLTGASTTPGAPVTIIDGGLTNGDQYQYALFAFDEADNASTALEAAGTPRYWSSFAVGVEHAVLLAEDGTVSAWGMNRVGQLGVGTQEPTLGIVKVCEEYDSSGGTCTTFLGDVTTIAAGRYHSLAIKSDGTVWGWGSNSDGALGNGTATPYEFVAGPVCEQYDSGSGTCTTHLSDVIAVAAGESVSLGLKEDGTVWAWGRNSYGLLGDGTKDHGYTAAQVCQAYDSGTSTCTAFLTDAAGIAMGSRHAAAFKNDGTGWAWGGNSYHQLADGTAEERLHAVQMCQVYEDDACTTPLTGIEELVLGSNTTTIRKGDGTVWSWGWNTPGVACGSSRVTVPTQICLEEGGVLSGATAIAGGAAHIVALLEDGTLWTLGDNHVGALGDGTTHDRAWPVQVCADFDAGTSSCERHLDRIFRVFAGYDFSVALRTDGNMYSWGGNNTGQLGLGIVGSKGLPIQVGVDADWVEASAGTRYSLARKEDGTVWAWGGNSYRELGIGRDTAAVTSPEPVCQVYDEAGRTCTEVFSGATRVMAANVASFALKGDGTVWAWGYDSNGALGLGEVLGDFYAAAPSQVCEVYDGGNHTCTTFLTDVASLGVGAEIAFARKNDGTVWGWGGKNSSGELGRGTMDSDPHPTAERVCAVYGATSCTTYLSDVAEIAVSYGHGVVRKNDGTIWAWGHGNGNLGDGAAENSAVPLQVCEDYDSSAGSCNTLFGNVVALAPVSSATLALRGDGTIWGWGYANSALGLAWNPPTPELVNADTDWDVLVPGSMGATSVAFKGDGSMWIWGDGYYGQLGDARFNNSTTPVQPCATYDAGTSACTAPLANVADVSVASHALAVLDDGTLWAWGSNLNGQIGDGTGFFTTPQLVVY